MNRLLPITKEVMEEYQANAAKRQEDEQLYYSSRKMQETLQFYTIH